MEKVKEFTNIRKNTRLFTPSILILYSIRRLSQSFKKIEIDQGDTAGNEEIKLSLLSVDLILYINDPKISTVGLLQLINMLEDLKLMHKH